MMKGKSCSEVLARPHVVLVLSLKLLLYVLHLTI